MPDGEILRRRLALNEIPHDIFLVVAGAVREHKGCFEQADGGTLCGDCIASNAIPALTLADHVAASERRRIIESLAVNQGRIAETAAQLGISRKNLWEKMKKHEIRVQGVEEV